MTPPVDAEKLEFDATVELHLSTCTECIPIRRHYLGLACLSPVIRLVAFNDKIRDCMVSSTKMTASDLLKLNHNFSERRKRIVQKDYDASSQQRAQREDHYDYAQLEKGSKELQSEFQKLTKDLAQSVANASSNTAVIPKPEEDLDKLLREAKPPKEDYHDADDDWVRVMSDLFTMIEDEFVLI